MVFKQLKRVKNALDDLNVDVSAGIDLEPQTGTPEGRYPIGNDSGFYRTPEVIDPRDPINYPDSPWNGGNPIDSVPIGMEIDLKFHACGWDLSVGTTFAFLKLPVGGLSYRHPGECRKEPPPPDRTISRELETKKRNWDEFGASDSDLVICGISSNTFAESIEAFKKQAYGEIFVGNAIATTTLSMGGWEGDMEKLIKYYPSQSYDSDADSPVWFSAPTVYSWDFITDKNWTLLTGFSGAGGNNNSRITLYQNRYHVANVDGSSTFKTLTPSPEGGSFLIFIGRFGTLKSLRPSESLKIESKIPSQIVENNKLITIGTKSQLKIVKWNVDFFTNLTNPSYSKNPPPPPDDDKECCMECCSQSNQQQQDSSDLLRKILKKVENVEKRVGCDDFPFNMPKSLVQKRNGWLEALLPPETTKIENLQQLNRQIFLLSEELWGMFPLEIEIKDSDPTKPGEQPQGMKIQNISEAFGELTAIGANASINSEVIINITTRLLYELAASRQTVADTNAKTQALIEFFGFKTKDEIEKMPLSFSPGKDRLDETLKESEHPVSLTKFDDKKKSYKQDMASLLHSATIIKSVFAKSTKGDTASIISEIVKNQKKANEKTSEALQEKLKDDFNKFCENFEKGWSDQLPETPDGGMGQPWGESYANRPKVVRVIKKDSTTE